MDEAVRVAVDDKDRPGPNAETATDGVTYVPWDDNRNATGEPNAQDVYFTRVYLDGSAPVASGGPSTGTKVQRVLLGLAVGIALCGVALVVTRALASRGESPAPVDSPWPAGHERLARTNQTNVAGRDHQLGRLDDTAAAQAVEDLREWPGQRFGHQPLLDRVWSLRATVRVGTPPTWRWRRPWAPRC